MKRKILKKYLYNDITIVILVSGSVIPFYNVYISIIKNDNNGYIEVV